MTEHFGKRIHKDALTPSLGQSQNLTKFSTLKLETVERQKVSSGSTAEEN